MSKEWSSFEQDGLIMESWRGYLNEVDAGPPPVPTYAQLASVVKKKADWKSLPQQEKELFLSVAKGAQQPQQGAPQPTQEQQLHEWEGWVPGDWEHGAAIYWIATHGPPITTVINAISAHKWVRAVPGLPGLLGMMKTFVESLHQSSNQPVKEAGAWPVKTLLMVVKAFRTVDITRGVSKAMLTALAKALTPKGPPPAPPPGPQSGQIVDVEPGEQPPVRRTRRQMARSARTGSPKIDQPTTTPRPQRIPIKEKDEKNRIKTIN
tara:strand:- start:188 stop:979 length:792 start_codon:yes stop_codon:yes gene_type:complete